MPEATTFGQYVSTDLVGPLMENGTKSYIVTYVDHYTNFLLLDYVENKEAATIAKSFINTYVKYFSICQNLCSDRGTEFVNSLHKEMMSLLGITRNYSSALHPQTQGKIEV